MMKDLYSLQKWKKKTFVWLTQGKNEMKHKVALGSFSWDKYSYELYVTYMSTNTSIKFFMSYRLILISSETLIAILFCEF